MQSWIRYRINNICKKYKKHWYNKFMVKTNRYCVLCVWGTIGKCKFGVQITIIILLRQKSKYLFFSLWRTYVWLKIANLVFHIMAHGNNIITCFKYSTIANGKNSIFLLCANIGFKVSMYCIFSWLVQCDNN